MVNNLVRLKADTISTWEIDIVVVSKVILFIVDPNRKRVDSIQYEIEQCKIKAVANDFE